MFNDSSISMKFRSITDSGTIIIINFMYKYHMISNLYVYIYIPSKVILAVLLSSPVLSALSTPVTLNE